MQIGRRNFVKLAASAGALPLLSRPSRAQLAPNPSSVRPPSPAERAAMARLAQAFMGKFDVPGLSVAIGYAGAIVHQAAYGLADLEQNEAATPHHLFRIASISKMITSVTLFRLIEENRVKLTDRVFGPGALLGTDYGGPPYSPGIDQITLEHLLTHTGGGWTNDNRDPMFSHPHMDHAQLISWTLANRPLDHPPGQHYAYSNFGYCVLGRVIEKLTGRRYDEHVRSEVLARCGVTDMTIAGNTREQRQPGEVAYYSRGESPYGIDVRRMDSHGGWIATPTDLVQFLMHVDGYARPTNILRPHTIQTMTTAPSYSPDYAKGFCINRSDNWWHNGSLPGTSTIAVRTHGGFCWSAFTNTRRQNTSMDSELDQLNWTMARQVGEWRVA
ncbi:serine hydrolase domain-containing protein [Bradyrhizobium guangdongense]|uniref:Penicillin-binding protein n=1 Tax=Bradyrhizobium guangdongense TaxID=1325090 RepID=A0A410V9Q0_9BRAD|nr:serine hydrolase domain-containing protein [Bradyrhizobium guangdongense]QAU40356.1 penicillin-binding protein [Bradyrhizobium guangdongense]QOZ61420.1 penicillin-binding protein [Bradyrhizobium guangdongense]GGI22686.1 penicillin-binding protein [Bradyrhizobium guangdongense]